MVDRNMPKLEIAQNEIFNLTRIISQYENDLNLIKSATNLSLNINEID